MDDRYWPEPPDDREPEDNIPDAVMDDPAWSATPAPKGGRP